MKTLFQKKEFWPLAMDALFVIALVFAGVKLIANNGNLFSPAVGTAGHYQKTKGVTYSCPKKVYNQYTQSALNAVKKLWVPAKKLLPNKKHTVNAYFEILANGYPQNISVTQPSSNPALDNYTVMAIVAAAPYQAHPNCHKGSVVSLNLKFTVEQNK